MLLTKNVGGLPKKTTSKLLTDSYDPEKKSPPERKPAQTITAQFYCCELFGHILFGSGAFVKSKKVL